MGGEILARTADAAQYFVEYEMNPMTAADLANIADICCRRYDTAGRQATDRLDDEGQHVPSAEFGNLAV